MKGLSLILFILMLLSLPVFSCLSLSCIFVHRLPLCLCCFFIWLSVYYYVYTSDYVSFSVPVYVGFFMCAPSIFSVGVTINFWSLFMPWSMHISVCFCVCMSVYLDVYKFCVLYVYVHFGVTLCLYDFALFLLSFWISFYLRFFQFLFEFSSLRMSFFFYDYKTMEFLLLYSLFRI